MTEEWKRVKSVEEFGDDGLIRTHKIEEGIPNLWGYNDFAHIWIGEQMYRITKKGTILKLITGE